MPDYDNIRRLVEGTVPPSVAKGPKPTPEEARQIARQAIIKAYERDHPPAPLDRLDPEERDRYLP